MAVRYGRPRLITTDDKRYRQHIEYFMIQRQNQRATQPPGQRHLFGGQAEAALRDWLAARLTLADTRILEYEEWRGRRSIIKYRELDALVLERRRSAWAFEIKATRTADTLRRAVNQLRETRAILRLLFSEVFVTILLVDTGIPTAEEVATLMASDEAPPTPPATLAEKLDKLTALRPIASLDESLSYQEEAARSEPDRIDVLCFTPQDIIDMVGAENLALDWEADNEAPDPQPRPRSSPVHWDEHDAAADSADDEQTDDEDNPLAAALRRAGLKQE